MIKKGTGEYAAMSVSLHATGKNGKLGEGG